MARKEKELDLYLVNMKYIWDLHNVDDNVMSVSPQTGKENRPFVGIIMILEKKQYCIPLTSAVGKTKFNKKSNIDFLKIPDPILKDQNGSPITIGVLNINNMIPVSENVIVKLNYDDFNKKMRRLLIKEIKWCRENIDIINNRAKKVYSLVVDTPEKSLNLTKRCCDFKKLEKVLEKWNEKGEN